ncbi:MAG: GNAT family N-acetyltransferase [Pseudomonadota bacterium]
MTIDVRPITGAAIADVVDDLAALRIEVFCEWPYLYEGTLDYERWYLGQLAASPDAIVVGAFEGVVMVGAATGVPLAHEHAEFVDPLRADGIDPKRTFYLAESVLRAPYRGRGIGHAFFDHREAHARAVGADRAVFCAVIRPATHPRRPCNERRLEPFWEKRGYRPLVGVMAHFGWRDIGDAAETEKRLQFWSKFL